MVETIYGMVSTEKAYSLLIHNRIETFYIVNFYYLQIIEGIWCITHLRAQFPVTIRAIWVDRMENEYLMMQEI